MNRLLLSILFVCSIALSVFAQNEEDRLVDSLQTELDTLTNRVLNKRYMAINLGASLSAYPLNKFVYEDGDAWELNAYIILGRRLGFTVDLGYSNHLNIQEQQNFLDPETGGLILRGYTFSSSGSYVSLGPDLNVFGYASLLDQFTIGLRYERASFNHSALAYVPNGNQWQSLGEFNSDLGYRQISASDENVAASWLGVEMRLMAELFRYVYLATSAKLQFNLDIENDQNLKAAIVPGFGYVRSAITPTANISLYFRIPVKYTIPRRKKFLPVLY